MKIEDFHIDFESLKEGDILWDSLHGEVIVDKIVKVAKYPIKTRYMSYSTDGRQYNYREESHNNAIRLFKSNPFEALNKSEYPKLMEVSCDNFNWYKKIVLCELDGNFISASTNDIDVLKRLNISNEFRTIRSWEYVREIPKIIEITMEEIAQLVNCDVKHLKIKK